jgi:hypothetical protein
MFEDTYLKWEKSVEDWKLIISSTIYSKDDEHSTSSFFFQAATCCTAEQSKALFVCFQIAINDTAVQLSVKKNELKHNKSAKKLHLQV